MKKTLLILLTVMLVLTAACSLNVGDIPTGIKTTVAPAKSLANYINTDFQPTAGKVLSMMSVYKNCYAMYYNGITALMPNDIFSTQISAAFGEAVNGGYAICHTGPLSFGGHRYADSFQYMLCIKDSPAATAFNKECK